MLIPTCVKEHVKRIVAEYESAYNKGEVFYSKIVFEGIEYTGVETTWFCLEEVKKFQKLLECQEGPLFVGTEEAVKEKLYEVIHEYYEPLSAYSISEITKDVYLQKQLMRALKKAIKRADTKSDAEKLMNFIKNAKHMSWSQDDEHIERRYFKLVKSEAEFEEILAKGNLELTPGNIDPYEKIRVVLVRVSSKEQYKKKNIIAEYKTLVRKYQFKDSSYDIYKMFDFWYDVKKSAFYYVYIPNE